MKVRYTGKSFYTDGLTDGRIYEVLAIEGAYLRVVDDSQEDYLYEISAPGPLDSSTPGGKWEIIEDVDGALKKAFERYQ